MEVIDDWETNGQYSQKMTCKENMRKQVHKLKHAGLTIIDRSPMKGGKNIQKYQNSNATFQVQHKITLIWK